MSQGTRWWWLKVAEAEARQDKAIRIRLLWMCSSDVNSQEPIWNILIVSLALYFSISVPFSLPHTFVELMMSNISNEFTNSHKSTTWTNVNLCESNFFLSIIKHSQPGVASARCMAHMCNQNHQVFTPERWQSRLQQKCDVAPKLPSLKLWRIFWSGRHFSQRAMQAHER